MARQLPIVNQRAAPPPGEVPPPDVDDDRPPWHWSGIGAVLIFTAWLPLSMVSELLAKAFVTALVPDGTTDVAAFLGSSSAGRRTLIALARLLPHLGLTLVFGAFVGGALVGRFGGKAGAKEAAVAGLLAATTAWALTAVQLGIASTYFLWPPVALVGFAAALAGGRFGRSRRQKSG